MTPPTSGTGQSDQLAGTATVVDAVHKAIDGVGKALGSATQVTSKSLESIAREALPAILEDWGFSDLELLFKALRDGSAYDFNLASLHAVGRDPAATAALWTLCKQLGGEGAVWMFVTALSHQFGTKAAHLILQKLILEEAPRDLHPSVPKFVAVPHKAVAAFLEQHLPGWSDLPIQSLGQEVEKVFEAHPEECVHRCGLSGIMSKAREKNGSLMVRSTGMEDSKQMSNAGGNESVVDVKPEAASVARAIGKVIASYMSEDSLAQRRLLGNVQEKSPFVPVLVQTMFGESESAGAEEIPVGGAFFTQEAQGPTPGLVVIQATYGHGEGVMMGKGPSDSYYLLDGQRYSAVSSKRYRLVPGGGRLVPEMNEPEVWDRPALSPAVLAHFEKLCRHFERVYGCPMDGEFVWDPVKQRLHIVQVRPIVMRPAQGSYVDLQQAKKLQRVRMKECVVSAGGGVVTVEKPAQIVFAKTLLQALQDLKSRPKGTVRAAVVESSCKILEHGASVFREAQIPLLVGSKVEIPNKHQLLVDPQRCSLWVVHEHLETMRSLAEWFGQPWTEPEIIRKGTIRHPIAAVLSSMATHGSRTIAQVLGEGEQNRLLAGRTWRPDPDGPLESLLDAIGDAEQPEQLRAAYAFLSYALARRMEALKKAGASHRIQVSFRTTWQQIETLGAQGILYAQGAAAHADKRIPLMASWVSALLTQEGTSTLGRSIAQVLRSHREPPLATPEQMNEIQKVWEAEKMDHRLEEVGRVLMALQTVIFDPDLKDRWPQIVRALLLSGPVGSSDVLEAVSALQELDLLTSWINGPCAEKLRSMTTASAAEALTDVMGAMMSWDLDIRELQSDSSALRLQMATGWQELSSWEKLEGFEGRWIEFRELVLDRVKKYVSLLRGLEGETRKIQAARLLAQAIDLTDAVIKMVQGAPGIPIEERRRRVCCMVRNFTMLSMLVVEVVMDVPKEETLPVTRTFWEYEHGGRTLSYFSIWTNAVRALADEAQLGKWREDHHGFLQPGKLIVSGAIFTAGTRPSRHIGGVTDIKANQNEQEELWPLCLTTKDDEITLSHQNGMAACWLVDTWLLSVTKALPIESVLLIKGLAGAQVRRISFEGRRVKTELSLPLRNHAASVMILQDPSSPVIHVELSLVGHNLNSRWERCGRLLKGTYPTLTWEIEKRVGSPQTPEPESASQLFRAVLELNCGSLDDSGRLGKDLSSALNATNGGLSPVLLGRSIAAQSLGAIVRLLAWRMTQVDVNQFAWKADIRELFRGNEGNLSAEEHVEALRFLKQPWMSGMQTDSAVEQRRKVLLDDLWEDPDWLLSVASKSPRNLLLGNRTGFLDRRA
ncbi:MAG: PEP/pyruvate-binding domain-containing protein, partial [Chlamydiia bacterium]